jgi:hypothetical protein
MADADRNNLSTDHLEDTRNQRTAQPRQPGATGKPDGERSPEEARDEAEHTYGKTRKHTS